MAVSATPPAICGGAPRPAEPPVLAREVFDTLVNGGAGTGSRCEMVEIHGAKVASFRVRGRELVCLPQVFELFLKHLVGGLHTVYTKLKRLDICPVVCTVEQVRALRGLGAIQPGVNRCKLIAREDFEALYSDCTSASSRPGRPPKRSVGGTAQDGPRLLYPGVPGLLPPGFLSSTGLTTAAMSEAMKLHKMKLMALNRLHGRDSQNSGECEQEERSSSAGGSECSWEKERLQSPALNAAQYKRLQQNHHPGAPLDLPFVVMPHPLLPVSLPPASVAMAMSQMNHLNTMANMAAAAQMCRAGASVIKEHVQDSPSSVPFIGEPQHLLPQPSSHPSSSASSSPASNHRTTDHLMVNTPNGDLTDMDNASRVKSAVSEKEDFKLAIPVAKPGFNKQVLPPGFTTPFLFADDLTSLETLLTNIQGLLKVAVENARKQEKRIQQEKKELKMELFREREMRENLERQLTSELQSRAAIQRRLKREKKAKRKLQEALEFESKRREQAEQALQRAGLSDGSCQSFSTAPLIQRAAPCASLHPALNGGLLVQQDTVSGSLCGAPFIQRGTMSDGLGSAPLVQRGTSCDGLGRSSLTQRTTSPDALRSSTSEAVLLEEEPEHNGSPQEKPAAQGNRGNIKTAMDH